MLLFYILLFTFLGSVVSLIGGVLLLIKEDLAIKASHFLMSFAAGVLLATAFLDLLPEAFAKRGEVDVFFWTLFGVLSFFLFERFIRWFHHHHEHEEKEIKQTVPLIILGDSIHNFIDGVVIAATFLVNIPLGIITALAVALHEIPQEIGDFGILLHRGMPGRKVLAVNILSALLAMLGAILTFFAADFVRGLLPVFISLTAGFFIYIAASDLIPEIHYEKRKGFATVESLLLLFGVFLTWASTNFLDKF